MPFCAACWLRCQSWSAICCSYCTFQLSLMDNSRWLQRPPLKKSRVPYLTSLVMVNQSRYTVDRHRPRAFAFEPEVRNVLVFHCRLYSQCPVHVLVGFLYPFRRKHRQCFIVVRVVPRVQASGDVATERRAYPARFIPIFRPGFLIAEGFFVGCFASLQVDFFVQDCLFSDICQGWPIEIESILPVPDFSSPCW